MQSKKTFVKHFLVFALIALISLPCVACGSKGNTPAPVAPTNGETLGQTAPPVSREELVSGRYYLVSNGKYYPLLTNISKQFDGGAENQANPNRKIFFPSSREKNIPTLFLGSEDKIIFYSQEKLLDYVLWERFRDEGYTIGFRNIKAMKSKRIYLDLSEDASTSIISFADTSVLAEMEVPYIMIDKIGGVQITSDAVSDGMILGLAKDSKYSLDLYVGTNYKHHLATANVKVLRSMEMFASTEYETLQTDIYEIKVPSYLTTGYYTIANTGIIRIVKDESYSPYTYYNEPLLVSDPQPKAVPQYSEYPPLNYFKSNIPGMLGYNAVVKGDVEKDESILFKKSAVVTRELYFPSDVDCSIKIISEEHAGECYLTIGSKRYFLQPQEGCFYIDYLGNGEQGTLTLTSFYEPIEVNYYGCTESIPEPEATEEEV